MAQRYETIVRKSKADKKKPASPSLFFPVRRFALPHHATFSPSTRLRNREKRNKNKLNDSKTTPSLLHDSKKMTYLCILQ